MKDEIKLGDEVKCKITGYKGIAIARVEFINGCTQYDVQQKVGKDGKMPESISIDSQSLEVVTKKKKAIVKKETGGRNSKHIAMRGY